MKTPLLTLLLLLTFAISILPLVAQSPRNALAFDGIDDFVFFDYNNRGITSEVTVEAWVKTGASKLQLITAKYDRDGEHGYQLVMSDGKAAFSGRDGSGVYRISGYSPRTINDNNWHHLAGTCKNGTWSIYIDGVLESQSVTGYSAADLRSNAPFTVGNYYLVNNDYFQGQVDELKIWKRGLSVDEIRAGMCQTADKTNTDLVVYLKFDEGSGSTLLDHSKLGINGTLRNMNAQAAWMVSGAPVGDISVYRYTNKWDSSLELITPNVHNFSVVNVDPAIKGFHLYKIATPPTHTNGINNAQEVKVYFGLFKVGDPDKKYKVYFKDYNLKCGIMLYRRSDNTVTSWSAATDTVKSPSILYTNAFNYGEFVATGNYTAVPESSTPVEVYTCANTSVMLQAPLQKDATYLWSTGEKTSSIEVANKGTYTVTVSINSCPAVVNTFIVSNDECPIIPNIITPNNDGKNDTFVVTGLNTENIDIEVFNRWGKSIFKSNSYTNNWTANSAGLYYYHIKSRTTGKEYKGWVEVIK